MSYSVVVNGETVSCYSSMRRAKQDYELVCKVAPDSVVSIVVTEVKHA